MVAGLLAVVAMAFRVSWNALRDVATSIGADGQAAFVYHTVASLVLNYVHGLVPTLHGGSRARLADWAPAHWALVLLASSLPVGSIFFGSDLVAKVLHHKPEPAQSAQTMMNRSVSDLGGSTDVEPVESVYESPAPPPAVTPTPADRTEAAVAVKSVAVKASRPRRVTGSVPPSARTARPTRTPAELLDQAREKTADWSDKELTADAIREAVRTSAANARTLRDALKAERAEAAERPALHAVPTITATAPVTGPADDTKEQAS
jgi:hypothetical protein